MTKRLRYAILAADLLWITLACIVAHWLRYDFGPHVPAAIEPPHFYVISVCIALAVWIFLYFNQNLEGFSRGWHLPTICSHVIVAAFYLIASLLALGFLAKINYSRLAILILAFLVPAGLIAIRCMAWWVVKSWLRLGPARRVVIVGSGRVARELANKIAGHPEMMIEVVGFLFPSDAGGSVEPRPAHDGATTVRTLNALELLQQKQVKELILAEQLPSGPESEKLIASCHRAGMLVHLVPQWYELYLSKARLTEIDDVPMVSIEARKISDAALAWKRVMDLAIGAVLFVLTAPLLGIIAVILRGKKGRAFKSDLRCGLNGAQFQMFRFNVDRWAKNLVGFEKFLARFSLTELPQLLNIVRGEMSLVGPRPESPDRVKHYSAWQRQRLSVKPGLTGLAQVYGLREQHSSEEKAHFDLQYIYHWSLFFDFSLLLQTAWTLMFRLLEGKRHAEATIPEAADSASISIREGLHADRS